MGCNFKDPFGLAAGFGEPSISQFLVPDQRSELYSVDLKLGRSFGPGEKTVECCFSSASSSGDSAMESSSLGPSKRARLPSNGTQIPSCLVDGCTADLGKCRDYHRRHKVCEVHSKTARVFIKGHEQRFCQQCSRFHSLGEFDEGKRSCRKRLDGHNRRRRKPQPDSLSMNSARLFSDHHAGTRYLQFGSSQIFSTTVAATSHWHAGSIKSENESVLDYSNNTSSSSSRQSTLNFIASNNSSHKSSLLLPTSSTLSHHSSYNKAGKQFPFLQQPTAEDEEAAGDSSGGLQSSKLFVDSNRALSLLSSPPMVHPDLNPQVQSSVHSLSSCYNGLGIESESIGSVLAAADGSSNSNSNGGLFQVGPGDDDGSNGNASGSHDHHLQTLSFTWQ
ncbi:unnamed protein product [Linum tenue]|uniref:SBP-type domain-containing protein n=1 Tax=Linum tenue TaxID=586396 RepID=A0AAV0S2G7_9ROSI|nr:unnamed protein product [Linum tenue]